MKNFYSHKSPLGLMYLVMEEVECHVEAYLTHFYQFQEIFSIDRYLKSIPVILKRLLTRDAANC